MSLFLPDRYLSSVLAVDLDDLQKQGKRAICVDLDNTILSREDTEISPRYKTWAHDLLDRGFIVCILSNNHTKPVSKVAKEFGFDFVCNAVKPLPFGFVRAVRKMGVTREETVMIGDQLFTDILGANVLGIDTIMVLPLAKKDLKHTLMLRKVEKLFIKDRQPEA